MKTVLDKYMLLCSAALKNYIDADSLVEEVVFISQKHVGGADKY